MSDRTAEISRETGETKIRVRLNIDGQGRAEIDTPIGFMNHMLHALAKHSMIDLNVAASGDIETGSHHTVEDTAIVIGRCLAGGFRELCWNYTNVKRARSAGRGTVARGR